MSKITAIGELLIDFASVSVTEQGYPVLAANPGGAPCNYLAAASEYGAETEFIGKVGSDTFGRMLRDTLHSCGIKTHGLVFDDSVFTTLAFVTLDENGDRSFSFARKPGADICLRADEVDPGLIDRTDILHFGTLSLTDEPAISATRFAVSYAHKRGKLVSCDLNYRPALWYDADRARETMLYAIGESDILKLSDEEAMFVFGLEPEAALEKIFADFKPSLVMLTLGAKGCLASNRKTKVTVPAPKVKPVDTTGAGDIFGGSAAAKLLETGKHPADLTEEELTDIIRFAVTAASLSTEKRGGIPSVPKRTDVEEALTE